jgi:hypothetical protein
VRLLDQVVQDRSQTLFALAADRTRLFNVGSPVDFAAEVSACPLRYVLRDDLTRASAELAFANGDRLAGCLDLIRIPAPLMWIEWNDAIHRQVIYETSACKERDADAAGRQAGVLLRAAPNGLNAVARTFWSAESVSGKRELTLSPLETHFDLTGDFGAAEDFPAVLAGGLAGLRDSQDQGVTALLDCVRFKFDERWAEYYRAAATTADKQRTVVYDSLAAIGHDAPLLLAFFLLLNARDATSPLGVSRNMINRKRLAQARAPLLDHIEISSTLNLLRATGNPDSVAAIRRPSRLHHVRGHIVRRANRIFWRTPHLRGRASAGVIRSRTVCLSYDRLAMAPQRGTGFPQPAGQIA